MKAYVHWNRRSGIDRRQLHDQTAETHRSNSDRRKFPNNDYMLIVGRTGMDSFELLISVALTTLVSAMAIGNYLGSI